MNADDNAKSRGTKMKKIARIMAATGFLGCATLGLVPLGCTNRLGPVQATQSAGWVGHPNLPDIVLERSKECVALYGQQMAPGRFVLPSTVEVDEDAYKAGVSIDGIPDTAGDFGACLRNVLQDLPVAEQPLQQGVETLKFHVQHANDSREALIRFIKVIPGVTIVDSEMVLEAEGYTIVVPVTVKVVAKQVKQVDLDKAILTKIGQMALSSAATIQGSATTMTGMRTRRSIRSKSRGKERRNRRRRLQVVLARTVDGFTRK